MIQYYKDKIWQEFTGLISWMILSGIFVTLENTAEGFVKLVEKDDKNPEWEADLEVLEFKNKKKGKKLTIWQKIRVKLESIDENLLRLNFSIIEPL